MRAYSFDFVGARPCCLLTITRIDGTVEHITNASAAITISGTTWTPFPLNMGVRTSRNDSTPPTLGFNAKLGSSSPLKLLDVDRKKYERARVQIYVTNQANPTAADFEFDGEIRGKIQYTPYGEAQFDLISRFAITRDIFVRQFTLPCSWEFGDPVNCTIPIFPYVFGGDLADVARSTAYATGARRRVRFASGGTPQDYANVYLEATTGGTTAGSAPSFSSTVGATTADGSVVWTARNAWARYTQVSAVSSDNRTITLTGLSEPRATDSTWFSPCKILFATGEYARMVFKGSNFDLGSLTVQTYLPCQFAAVNDWIEIAPACDLTIGVCTSKFANAANHFGFPYQQGAKAQAMQLGLTT